MSRDLSDILTSSRLEVELFSVQVEKGGVIAYGFQLLDPDSMDSFDLQLNREHEMFRRLDNETSDWITEDALSKEAQDYLSDLYESHIEERGEKW